MPSIDSLLVYPIKSCAGVTLESGLVETRGLAGDRRYMLIDEEHRALTQRDLPHMSQIAARRRRDAWLLHAPGAAEELALPVEPLGGEILEVSLWGRPVPARLGPVPAHAWFSSVLATPCRLVSMGHTESRALDPRLGHPGNLVSFGDVAPILLASTASLAELNRRLPRRIDMRRFRPNLVVANDTPFAEDYWKRLAIGELDFDVVLSCTRCVLTTIDPDTGIRDPEGEPVRTLNRFRRGIVPVAGRGVLFGVYLVPRAPGTLRVGDALRVLELGQGPRITSAVR